ncbi:ABC transporter permease [Paenibacillus campi]|uniref:ABC transporter permease n=1 Tax=Paenibacillus campi TaxID=3106031 RepID=UPI002AFEF301|nr:MULTISPECIES: ABC transporter permease [unclassified Paenibacillus]
MNNASAALKVAAGLFLTIALITIVVVLFISAQEATKTAQNNFSGIQKELDQTQYAVYDNTNISGSQVVSSLRKFKDQAGFGIKVMTGKNPTGIWYFNEVNTASSVDSVEYGTVSSSKPSGSLADAMEQMSGNYINPTGTFKSEIVRDRSNVVRALIFKQN